MINRIQFEGNTGRDAELRYTQSGTAVVNFSLACSERWKDQSGEQKERTTWLNVVAWGRLGEAAATIPKGTRVYVEGRLQNRSWEDKEGNKRTSTELVASEIRLFMYPSAAGAKERSEAPEVAETTDGAPDADDIPF